MKERRHRRSVVGPAILIGFGLIFLLNNLGFMTRDVWDLLGKMWPLLLVATGLELLLVGPRSRGDAEGTMEDGLGRVRGTH